MENHDTGLTLTTMTENYLRARVIKSMTDMALLGLDGKYHIVLKHPNILG
jgi:hypothetical protein